MARVTLGGASLEGFSIHRPAASVRLLLPPGQGQALVLPTWERNEFVLPDGRRPTIRTFTPRRFDSEALELDLDIVLHDRGVASAWILAAVPNDPAAVSGPGRGYAVDRIATGYLLAGDESAIPAISQLLEWLPDAQPIRVILEAVHPDARHDLPDHPAATVMWVDLPSGSSPGAALVSAVTDARLEPDDQVWAAGEAAAMHRIRRHLFEERGLSRASATIRGYWKHRADTDEGGTNAPGRTTRRD